ncbi:TPR-like protein [Hesseltinella vesiculosa]|uniref:TPR-like protein n=1 Tax=Hesseltinella vesiculosa TaxID=101127 RepID=A0A1X2GPQ7_9FUNG|nr:TPR-like protein [Hesseltinella vesiculosa]
MQLDDIEGFSDEDQLGDEGDSDFMDDDELTGLMENAKAARKNLKTGGLDELEQQIAKDFATFEDNLIATTGIGKTRHQSKRQVTKGEARIKPEIKRRLGEANMHYIAQDYGKAIDVLQGIITEERSCHQAWNTLGIIHEEMGNLSKALEVRMVAAHMVGSDADLWKELGLKSIDNNIYRQAIYCFDKALTIDPQDTDTLWDRSILQKSMGMVDQAINGFQQILEVMPFHFKVVNELTQLYRIKGQTKLAIELYEEAVEYHIKNDSPEPETDDDNTFVDKLGYSEINMLSELYLILNDYRHALECIKTGVRHVQQRNHETQWFDRPDDDDEYLLFHPSPLGLDQKPKPKKKRRSKRAEADDDEEYGTSYQPSSSDDDDYARNTGTALGKGAINATDLEQDRDTSDMTEEEEKAAQDRLNIPIDLRVRLGICRIYLGQHDLAQLHFEYLFGHEPLEYPDLFQDVAYAFMDQRFFESALIVFQRIIQANNEIEVELLVKTADCYREVGQLDTAVIFYVNVLDEQPDNLEVMTSLAMVYEEQGKEDEALQLVDYVVKKTREIRKQRRQEQQQSSSLAHAQAEDRSLTEQEQRADSALERLNQSARVQGSLFDEHQHYVRQQQERRREQKRRETEERQINALKCFESVKELEPSVPSNIMETDRHIMRQYIRTFQTLWDDFRTTRAMFPSSKKVLHDGQGFYAARSGKKKQSSMNEAREMAARLRQHKNPTQATEPIAAEDRDTDEEDEEGDRLETETQSTALTTGNHFRNISYDDWMSMFIKFTYFLAFLHRSDEALTVLRTISVSAMASSPQRNLTVRLTTLGVALMSKNYLYLTDFARYFVSIYQFQPEGYRMYSATFTSGLQDMINFSASDSFKFFVRSIKLMDILHSRYIRLRNGETIPETDQEAEEMRNLQSVIQSLQPGQPDGGTVPTVHCKDNFGQKRDWMEPLPQIVPSLLTLFGHMTALGGNHLGAMIFYMRAYSVAPNDPLTTLCLAIANIHRSQQRKTDNRHLQVIKGFQMLTRYCKLRGFNQESEYNMGRAYHGLGLVHLAVHHYERALVLPSAKKQGLIEPKSIDDVYTWPSPDMDEGDDEEDDTDLKREAAYNLHLIYMTSGSPALAQILLMKYCTI